MRPAPWTHLDEYRVGDAAGSYFPPPDTLRGHPYGAFIVPARWGADLLVIADADGSLDADGNPWAERPNFAAIGWDHASVTVYKRKRTPNYHELEYVRGLFWDDTETVLQFSVPRAQHVNLHPYCLHMWSPVGVTVPLPCPLMVG